MKRLLTIVAAGAACLSSQAVAQGAILGETIGDGVSKTGVLTEINPILGRAVGKCFTFSGAPGESWDISLFSSHPGLQMVVSKSDDCVFTNTTSEFSDPTAGPVLVKQNFRIYSNALSRSPTQTYSLIVVGGETLPDAPAAYMLFAKRGEDW